MNSELRSSIDGLRDGFREMYLHSNERPRYESDEAYHEGFDFGAGRKARNR